MVYIEHTSNSFKPEAKQFIQTHYVNLNNKNLYRLLNYSTKYWY